MSGQNGPGRAPAIENLGDILQPGGAQNPSDGTPSPGKPPLLHLNDLLNSNPNVTVHSSINNLIKEAEQCLQNAEAFRSFRRRPDLAFQNYMHAYVIAVELIPKNKDFSSLLDRKQAVARHTTLMKNIQGKGAVYEKLKEDIRRDNERSGVRPTTGLASPTNSGGSLATRPLNGGSNGIRGASQTSGHTNGYTHSHRGSQDSVDSAASAYPSSGRPVIQPKPQGLHGNSVQSAAAGPGGKSGQDLAERFANLRGQKNPVNSQGGPQPTNHQPFYPRPAQTRPTPAEVANISLISDLPDLPKVPEAIYSPARGTVSHESANLPSSNSRGMFSRTGSSTPSASQTRSPQLNGDYFVPFQAPGPTKLPPPSRPRVIIPDGDTVTPEELMQFMRASSSGFKVLIVDVRNRQDFDQGHIMSQWTICIEPEILQREHISAEDVGESMILAPQREQQLFHKRNEFDLVVFYNEDSQEINWRGGTPAENALLGLYNALRHFDYELEGDSKPAKLLKGGIEAWAGLMGTAALQISSTAANGAATEAPKPAVASRLLANQRPRARPIQDAIEAQRWEETVSNMDKSLVRTQEDFLRRFPSVSHIQESMTAPVRKPEPQYPPSAEIYNSLPAPPTRPAPAVPRQSYSGLRETGQEEHYTTAVATAKSKERKGRPRPVGLSNPGVWCYANASIQALFHSFGFADDLIRSDWQEKYQVPKKTDENLNNPQLLTKIVSNLFHWMSNGQFESMQCKTLMDYCCYVDSKLAQSDGRIKGVAGALGSRSRQQDAEEFIMFVMENIHDETNRLRNVSFDSEKWKRAGDRHDNAIQHWKGYRQSCDSIIDKYWRGLSQNALTCGDCGHLVYNHEAWDKIRVTVPADKKVSRLEDLLRANYNVTERRSDYKCEGCNLTGPVNSTIRLARMPELLCISLGRFSLLNMDGSRAAKTNGKVTYPINDLDLTNIVDQTPADRGQGREWKGPFHYYCYAAIMHGGDLQSGHYTAFVRNRDASVGDSSWYYCNDTAVSERTIENDAAAEAAGMYSKDSTTSAYILFYRRWPDTRR